MGIESFGKNEEHFRRWEDIGTLKGVIFQLAVDVLPETILMYKLGGDLYEDLKQALEDGIVNSGATDVRGIEEAAQRVFDDELQKRGLFTPEASRTFLTKLKTEVEAR